jgi:HK97 family phage major capsid protein
MEVQEVKTLIEEQGRLFEQFKQKHETELAEIKKFGTILPETKTAIDAMNARFDEIEVKMNRRVILPGPNEEKLVTPAMASIGKWFRYGLKGNAAVERMAAEEKSAFDAIRTKSLSASTDTGGGFLVPEDFQTEVIRKIANIAGIGAMVSRQTTSRDVVRWPKVNYSTDDVSSSGLTVTWEDETDTSTSTDPTPFGSVAIPTKKVRALVKVSRELLEDEAVDVLALLSDLAGDAFAIAEDNVFSVGFGGKKPEGFMTNPDIGTTNSGSSGAFLGDGLIDLVYALPEQYAANAVIMTKRTSLGAIRKLKDTTNQYLWQPSVQAGQPSTLLGYPLKTNEHIAAIAAAARAAIIADFKRLYKAIDKAGMSIQRLDEKYADTDEVGFIFRRRVGGAVVSPWAGRIQVLS